MKVLQVNCVYKKGSTGKIVYDIHKELQKKKVDSIVCYGRGKKIKEFNVYKTSSEFMSKFNNLKSRFTGMQYNGSYLATRRLIKIIKLEKPDIVHMHCMNGFFVNIYKILEFLKCEKIKTVITLHAEFMHTGNCAYSYECEKWKKGCGQCKYLKRATGAYFFDKTDISWNKMKKSFEEFDNLVICAVSSWIENRAKVSPIMSEKNFRLIYNGIETEKIFYPRNNEEVNQLRNKLGINKTEKIILTVTPNFTNPIKGGEYFIELARMMQEYKFIVVGFNGEKRNIPSNVITVKHTQDQNELAIYYSMADVFVITSLQDNYPTVCLEANSCGTPTVGFDVGGVKETIFENMGEVVEVFQTKQLMEAIEKWVRKKKEIEKSQRDKVISVNSKERMVEQYINLYNEIQGV